MANYQSGKLEQNRERIMSNIQAKSPK